MLAVEAAGFHAAADGRIERAAVSSATDNANWTASHRMALAGTATPTCAESCISSLPSSNRVQRLSISRNQSKARSIACVGAGRDDMNRDERAHQHLGADGHAGHFAFDSASTTA